MEGEGGGCDDDHHLHLSSMSEDVLIQILLCLPVKSMLRFKSVCKSWRSIIESPFLHLHATKLGHSSRVLFNRGEEHQEVVENKGNIFMLSGEEFVVFENLGRPSPPLVDLGEEFKELLKNPEFEEVVKFCVLVGSCNGIICLQGNFLRRVALWNPTIKQSRILPKPSNLLGTNPINYMFDYSYVANDDDKYLVEDVVAFGVDVKTNDYKVLLITTLQPNDEADYYWSDDDYEEEERFMPNTQSLHARRVHVYSSSTDSWRCIDNTLSAAHPNLQIYTGSVPGGLYLNGSHFFTASYQIKVEENFCTMPLIMSFDFTEEIFRTIQPPYDWSRKWNMNTPVVYFPYDWSRKWNMNTPVVYFIPFDEKIALVDAKAVSFDRFECDVWVLLNEQHNGVKEYCWTKFYTYESYRSPIALRCIANNGQFAIIYCPDPQLDVWKLRLLNLITGETKDLQSGCPGRPYRVDLNVSIYKPSLVQIDRHNRSGATTNEKCDGTL